jgi:uncharacterized protein YacL
MPREESKKRSVTVPSSRSQRAQLVFLVVAAGIVSVLFFLNAPTFVTWLIRVVWNRPNLTWDEIDYRIWSQVGSSALGFLVGLGLANLVWDWLERVRKLWDKQESGGKVTVALGIFIGLVASVPFLFVLYSLLSANISGFVAALFLLVFGFSTISLYVLQQIADVLPWSSGGVRGPVRRTGIKLLDTNILIDGRIFDVVRSGFMEGPFYVAEFVLEELQHIADSADPLRRQRGRRGLDVLQHLRDNFDLEVGTRDHLAKPAKEREEVDHRLVHLARAIGADIVTNDFNLNRVASLQGITVLNMNDLAMALRSNVLPSEGMRISVLREGNQPYQGVGYLEDGTMVVIENGKRHIGETIDVMVTQVIQTERGKMVFAAPQEEMDERPRRRVQN